MTNFNVLVQILVAVFGLNTYTTLTVSFHSLDGRNLPKFISNLLYLIGILGLICIIPLVLLNAIIENNLQINWKWQGLAAISAIAACVFSLYSALLRIENKPHEFNKLQILQSVVTGVLAIIFIVVFQWNWQGRLLSIVIGAVALMLFIVYDASRKKLIFKAFDIKEIRSAFAFGLPLLPHTLSFWFKSGVDRIIITSAVGLTANGIYSIALTFSAMVGIVTGAFFSAYAPHFFRDLSELDACDAEASYRIRKRLVAVIYLFTAISIVIVILGYIAVRVLFPMVISEKYSDAGNYFIPVMGMVLFDGLFSAFSGFAFYRRKTKVLGAITFLSSILQMGLTYVLVVRLGAIGAAYSGMTVSFITFFCMLIYVESLYRLPWWAARG